MRLFVLPALFAAVMMMGQPAWAASKPALSVADVPPLQTWQTQTKANIDYIGQRHGLDMWIATRESQLQLIYTTPDRQAMLVNDNLIGLNNEDATGDMQREFVSSHPEQAESMLKNVGQNNPPPNAQPSVAATEPSAAPSMVSATTPPTAAAPAPSSKSERLWQDLAKAETISFGSDTAPLVYMVADPTCDHCKALWQKLQPALATDSLHIKLLPIAILGQESQTAASAILSQPDPSRAWLAHIKGEKLESPATAEGIATLAANQNLIVTRYKLQSTPILIYRSHISGKIKLVFGNSADMTGIWTDIGVQPPLPAPTTPPEAVKSESP